MTFLGLLWYYLWIAPHLLQVVVVVAMVRHKVHQQFPLFFAYTGFEVCQFVLLFTMAQLPSTTGPEYVRAYSFGLAVSTALRFGIVHEVFAHLFRNYTALNRFGRPLFRWATVALLLAALGLAVYVRSNDPDYALSLMYMLDRTASILQCGLLVFLFLFSTYLGLSWRNCLFGITLGLGAFASVELLASAIRSQLGTAGTAYLDFLTMGAYHCCVLVWIFYLVVPERTTHFTLKALPEHDVEIWNQELRRLLQQ